MAQHLQAELEKVKKKLLTLSSVVERNLDLAIKSIKDLDSDLAVRVRDLDFEVDLMEVDLEEECLKALALYQPVASDLRFIIVALKINNDLERIADLAVNLSSRAKYLADLPLVEAPFDFDLMSSLTKKMVKNSIQCLIDLDLELAQQICRDDDEIDSINKNTYPVVFERIREHPARVEQLIHYLSISRFLERISDLSTNIAEDVIYMVEGVIVRHHDDGSKSHETPT